MIFASENAKLGLPEVSLGVTPGFGGTQRLVRLVGKIKAKEMIFTGDMIDAKRAMEIGLVNQVLRKSSSSRAGREIASKIATPRPLAVARAKRLSNAATTCRCAPPTGRKPSRSPSCSTPKIAARACVPSWKNARPVHRK